MNNNNYSNYGIYAFLVVRIMVMGVVIVMVTVMAVHARVGCMAHSYHLAHKYDTKEYHFVACNCPCFECDRIDNKNKCRWCGHVHDPRPMVIIGEQDYNHEEDLVLALEQETAQYDCYNKTPQLAFESLVKQGMGACAIPRADK